jgi:NAD(P)-dependent dehydrogenase (short-subunit alcohol dehydrogenase family)
MNTKRTFLISGAGSGIGKAMAQLLAQTSNLILLGRNETSLNQTLATLPAGQHQILTADVSDINSLAQAFKNTQNIAIDGIIANAGLGGENYWGATDRWNEIMATNLTGTYNLVNTFLPNLSLSSQPFKHIVITSSILARLGVANYSAYCASKAGLLGLMRSWAVQYAPANILVNAICPGWVNTQMAQDGLQGIADAIGISKADFFDIAMQSVPLKKMSQPVEIAQLINYLVNQTSLTGQSIDINGGAIMNS